MEATMQIYTTTNTTGANEPWTARERQLNIDLHVARRETDVAKARVAALEMGASPDAMTRPPPVVLELVSVKAVNDDWTKRYLMLVDERLEIAAERDEWKRRAEAAEGHATNLRTLRSDYMTHGVERGPGIAAKRPDNSNYFDELDLLADDAGPTR